MSATLCAANPSMRSWATHSGVFAGSWRGGALALHVGSAWGRCGLSRCVLGSIAPVDGAPPLEGKLRVAYSPDFPALRGEHGYGVRSLQDVPGGGAACAEHAD